MYCSTRDSLFIGKTNLLNYSEFIFKNFLIWCYYVIFRYFRTNYTYTYTHTYTHTVYFSRFQPCMIYYYATNT